MLDVEVVFVVEDSDRCVIGVSGRLLPVGGDGDGGEVDLLVHLCCRHFLVGREVFEGYGSGSVRMQVCDFVSAVGCEIEEEGRIEVGGIVLPIVVVVVG